jgi:predicted nucleotidyltransferase
MKQLDIINILRSQIKHVSMPLRIEAIYLYGSAIKGRLREDSDIDIAILTSYDAEGSERLELISKAEAIFTSPLKKLGIQQEISVFDLRDKYASVQLQYKVITEGIALYTKDVSERLEFENAVKREYFDFEPYLSSLRKRKYGDILQKV